MHKRKADFSLPRDGKRQMNIIEKIFKTKQKDQKSFMSPTVIELTGGAASLPAPASHNYAPYIESYADRAWVYSCVSIVAQTVAAADFNLKNANGEIIGAHPVLNLIYKPNPFMTGRQLREWIVTSLELTGNAYILKDSPSHDGAPRELFPLLSHLVEIVPSKNPSEPVQGYKYRAGNRTAYYAAKDVIHFKYFNPQDFYYGLSPLAAARESLETLSSAENYNKSFLNNSAVLSGVLSTDGRLDDASRARLVSAWNDKYTSAAKAHKVAVLEGGLKWQNISLSQKDMDFIEAVKLSRETVMSIFHVPPALVGVFDKSPQYSTKEQQRIFYQTAVLPKQTLILETLTEFLLCDFNGGEEMYFDKDTSNISVLKEDENLRAAAAKIYHDIGFTKEEIVAGLGLPFGSEQRKN